MSTPPQQPPFDIDILAVVKVLAGIAYMILEHLLGKTIHGSLIGVVLDIVSDIFKLLSHSNSKEGSDPMNTELKAILQLAFDLFAVGKDAVEKANFVTVLLPVLYKIAADIPAVVSGASDLLPELKVLPGSAQEADLISFIQSQVVSAGVTDAKAQAILQAALKIVSDNVQDINALVVAIKS